MEEHKQNENLKFIAIFLGVALFWFLGWIFVDTVVPVDQRSAFGDKFGFINSLFSGLALAVIIYSIILQQTELALQRKELTDTRSEFKDQNFQTTFFNLLNTQRQIPNDINVTISDLKTYDKYDHRSIKGREFFVHSKIEIKRISAALKHPVFLNFIEWDQYEEHHNGPSNEHEEQDLFQTRKLAFTNKYYGITKVQWMYAKKLEPAEFGGFCYQLFFHKFQYAIGHYFRHLYHILLFLEECEKAKMEKQSEIEKAEIKKEFQRYANFVQAQMATPELFLLFYNSLFFDKLRKELIKYNILENLHIEDLLDPAHKNVEGINLKTLQDLK